MYTCYYYKVQGLRIFSAPSVWGASGSEKVVHGLRACMDKHWEDDDFAVVKVDMCNAFNLVSR